MTRKYTRKARDRELWTKTNQKDVCFQEGCSNIKVAGLYINDKGDLACIQCVKKRDGKIETMKYPNYSFGH